MKRIWIALLLGCLIPAAGVAGESHGKVTAHVALSPDALQWVDMPAIAGAQMAVLSGDPGKSGQFVARFRLPAGSRVAPHWHPATENITVISGTLKMGLGNEFKEEGAMVLGPGAFGVMPAKMRHFAWCDEDVVIQLNNKGPWKIFYVNPGDDPAKKAASSASTP